MLKLTCSEQQRYIAIKEDCEQARYMAIPKKVNGCPSRRPGNKNSVVITTMDEY